MAKELSNNFERPIPQIDFIKYLLDNSGRMIDETFICEIIKKFGKDIIVKPALAYVMENQ